LSLAKIILSAVIFLIIIQFIQPARNTSDGISATDISKTVRIPESVQALLKNTCYDCHSNNTDYPWYSNIQPIGWLMAYDIKRAKNELNFSEFGSYSQRRQSSKLEGIANSIRDGIMPLSSYKMMHKNAQLSANEKTLLINWSLQSKESLSVRK
jgi:hypothetical protein